MKHSLPVALILLLSLLFACERQPFAWTPVEDDAGLDDSMDRSPFELRPLRVSAKRPKAIQGGTLAVRGDLIAAGDPDRDALHFALL